MHERVSHKGLFGGIDKDRKLAEATAECKALKLAERLREKAVEEVSRMLGIATNVVDFVGYLLLRHIIITENCRGVCLCSSSYPECILPMGIEMSNPL